ncbi:MAG: glycosyltransferase family 2 protein [Bacteroidota bacterium]
MEPKLSVVLTTLNEERNVERCLGSVRWADEVVVVDSFSRDGTVERARAFTDRIYQHEYPGSSRQVERGIGYARGPWILVLDADEEVTPPLAAEIRETLAADPDAAGFDILRKPSAFGRWIEHGGWFPDYQFRLFRKDRYRANHREVHGGFEPLGKKGRLRHLLLHHTYETIYSYVGKMNDYTSLQVSTMLAERPGIRVVRRDLLLHPLSHFLRMYFSRRGYRDGFHGFVLALLDAVYTLLLYAKVWEYGERKARPEGPLPPVTNTELNRLKHP